MGGLLGPRWRRGEDRAGASRGVGGRPIQRRVIVSVLVALVLFALPSPAFAHLPSAVSYIYTCALSNGSSNGNCWVRHSNADADWVPNGSPPVDVVARWRNGAGAWDQTNGHQFNYREFNDLTSSRAYWGPNDPCSDPNVIACTNLAWSNSYITESISYTEFESDLYWYTGTGAPFPGQYDLWSTAAHEFGHLAGLGHSANSSQTMNSTQPTASTYQRSLESGDRLGRCEIYGHGDNYWGGC